MENNPLVSVICLCYNHAPYVTEALNSVLSQQYNNIELIIADDCSSDTSVAEIQNWLTNHPHIVFLKNEKNEGNTQTFNKALALAKGEYIIDLAADDVMLPDCVTKQLETFRTSRYQNLGLVYGNPELIDEKGQHIGYYFSVNSQKKVISPRETGNIYLSVLRGGNSVCSVSSMVKRSVLNELGGYDSTLAYEDLDLWIRLSRKYEVDFIDAVIFQKREISTSLGKSFHSGRKARLNRINHSTYRILNKAFQLNQTKTEDQGLLKRIHYEFLLNCKNLHFSLALRYFFLELKVRFRRF